MSIEEIIEILTNGTWWDYLLEEIPEGDHGDLCDAIDAAIALLKTHPDNQPNEPLTEEELDGMEGKRVFVSGHRDGIIHALVGKRTTKNNGGQFLVFTDGGFCRVKYVLDRGGKIYRRPPEEEAR